jgi:hypothetical protein
MEDQDERRDVTVKAPLMKLRGKAKAVEEEKQEPPAPLVKPKTSHEPVPLNLGVLRGLYYNRGDEDLVSIQAGDLKALVNIVTKVVPLAARLKDLQDRGIQRVNEFGPVLAAIEASKIAIP